MKDKAKDIVYISFRCPTAMERRARIEAAKKDMNRSEFVLEALGEKLARIDAQGLVDQDVEKLASAA